MQVMSQKLSARIRDIDLMMTDAELAPEVAELKEKTRSRVRELRDGILEDGTRPTRSQIEHEAFVMNFDPPGFACLDWTTETLAIVEEVLAEKGDERDPSLHTISASDLVSKRIEWYLPDRIPIPSFCLLEGEGGLGKSLIALDLIARGSNGSKLPDGSAGNGIVKSLFFAAEDATHILKARLQAANAKLSNVTFVPWVDTKDGRTSFTLPTHASALEDMIVRTGARLVYLDSLFDTFAAGLDTNQARHVRSALGPLKDVAHSTGCVIIAVRHVNKAPGRAATRGLGSADFVNLARAVLQVAPHPSELGRGLLSTVKKNYGKPCDALAFRIEGVDIKLDDGHIENVPVIRWLGTDATTADEAALGVVSKLDSAEAALLTGLRRGSVRSADIEGQGYSRSTVWRAREALQSKGNVIKSRKVGDGGWIWHFDNGPEFFDSDEPSRSVS